MIGWARNKVSTKAAKMVGADDIRRSAQIVGGMATGLKAFVLRVLGRRTEDARRESLEEAMERMGMTAEGVDEAQNAYRKERAVLAWIAAVILCYLLYGGFYVWTSLYAPALTLAVLILTAAKMMVASFRVWQIREAKACPSKMLASMTQWVDAGEWWAR